MIYFHIILKCYTQLKTLILKQIKRHVTEYMRIKSEEFFVNNRIQYNSILLSALAVVESRYALPPWIWKGVSVTSKSAIYTLSYPRGQFSEVLTLTGNIFWCADMAGLGIIQMVGHHLNNS